MEIIVFLFLEVQYITGHTKVNKYLFLHIVSLIAGQMSSPSALLILVVRGLWDFDFDWLICMYIHIHGCVTKNLGFLDFWTSGFKQAHKQANTRNLLYFALLYILLLN